ncbi:hypothetical protein EV702DRAFT_1088140 [Suillus placidus]|uniref:Uncharacterized protein n=1 Tax=Suillus placidus TaxID=48579 RepID=A0A9P7A0W7_9AGAM|nr:hypothetical protein EV702DRAFT_1088140 [Suillus placidus]
MSLYNQKSGFRHVTGFCLLCAISLSIFGWSRISIQPISIMNQDVPGSAIDHHRIKCAMHGIASYWIRSMLTISLFVILIE